MGTRSWIGALCALLLWVPGSARADDVEEVLAAEPGGLLVIELPLGSIDVDTHDQPTVEIDGRVDGLVDLEVVQDDDEIRIRGRGRGLFGILPFGYVRLRARVPERFDLDLYTNGGHIDVQELTGSVTARTAGGHIEVQEIRGDVELETSGGRIEAKEIEGELEAETSGGPIRVSEVMGRCQLRTMGGGIRVSDAGDEVEAETSGGSIEVDFAGQASGRIRTSGGSIDVELPEGFGVDLRARTIGGQVRIDEDFAISGDVDREEAEVALDGGGPDLELETTGGSIRVDRR